MKQKFIYLRDIFKGHSSLWLGLVIASGFTGLDGIISPAVMGMLTNILTKRQFNQVWLVIALFFVAAVLTLWSMLQYLSAARADLLDQ